MSWQEKLIEGIGYEHEEVPINRANFREEADFITWLSDKATQSSLLLAHADDGVVWGYMSDNELLLSTRGDDRVSPPLRPETLQQLWLFDADTELHIWSSGERWQGSLIREVKNPNGAVLDEQYLLWGTFAYPGQYGFTLLEDGVQGLRHLPPSHKLGRASGSTLRDRVYLCVRHYLTPNAIGVNNITMSRLTGLGQLNHG